MSVYPDNVREQDIEVRMMSDEEQKQLRQCLGRAEMLQGIRELAAYYNADMPNDELHFLVEALDDAIGIMQQRVHALERGD